MTALFKRPKLTTQQVGAAGEHFVAAEIHRRGGYAVTFSGNMHDIDLLASDATHDRVISIQVKTKTAGAWRTTTKRAVKGVAPELETKFWVLVDLGRFSPSNQLRKGQEMSSVPTNDQFVSPPRQRRRLTAQLRADVVEAYEAGQTSRQVAASLKLGRSTVLGILKDAGVVVRPQSRRY